MILALSQLIMYIVAFLFLSDINCTLAIHEKIFNKGNESNMIFRLCKKNDFNFKFKNKSRHY